MAIKNNSLEYTKATIISNIVDTCQLTIRPKSYPSTLSCNLCLFGQLMATRKLTKLWAYTKMG